MKKKNFLKSILFIVMTLWSFSLFANQPPHMVKPEGPPVPQVISPEHETRTWNVRKLPDTGQRSEGTDVFGEDLDYQISTLSYTDNGDNTVTDNVTNLMWQKDSKGDLSFAKAKEYCSSLDLGGHNGWRLPDTDETYNLVSIDSPPFNSSYFTNDSSANTYYSSSTMAGDDSRVWGINKGGGIGAYSIGSNEGDESGRIVNTRCVREIAPPKTVKDHFTDNKDGTVKDNSNGLVWQQKDGGAMTWEDGLRYCEGLKLGGKEDWRMPNVKEARSMCDYTLYSPSVDLKYFPDLKTTWHWTSSTTQRGKVPWFMNYVSSSATYIDRETEIEVRCVRGGF